jgi:hypothetical protein
MWASIISWWRQQVYLKRRYVLTRLHGTSTQTTVIFLFKAYILQENPNNSFPTKLYLFNRTMCLTIPRSLTFLIRTFYRAKESLAIIITWFITFQIAHKSQHTIYLENGEWNPEMLTKASRYHIILKSDFVCWIKKLQIQNVCDCPISQSKNYTKCPW